MRSRILVSVLLAGVVILIATRRDLTGFQQPLTVLDLPEATGVVKLEFGLTAREPRDWEGTVTASAGEILSTWGWHFVLPDRIIGKNGWSFTARLFSPPGAKYRGQDKLPVPVLPNGVFIAVKAPEATTISVTTNRGDFAFKLSDLERAGRLPFLDGDAAAVFTPPTRYLTRGEASHHDFPSVATRGQETFVAWTTFHNEANFVYMAHRKEGKWTTYRASKAWGDYYSSAIATEGADRVIVSWSEYKDDRWRLVSRALNVSSGEWEGERYVCPGGHRQMFHRMATDARGTPWIVWQEFSDGNYDIFAASHSSRGWSEPVKLSTSGANDWNPAIAAAPDGTVYVAWDGYEAGNYDIYLRPIRGGTPGALVRVTRAETYDAHVSLAADAANHLWLAWEESGPNWGKDTGVVDSPGLGLHASRSIRLVRYANGAFLEPATPLAASLPGWLGTMHEFPQVAIAANGLPYIFFRHYLHRLPMRENEHELRFGPESRTLQPWYDAVRQMWDIFVVGFDGRDWLPVRHLPESTGRCYMQTAAALEGDKLLYFWPTDGRTYTDPYVKTAQLQFAEFRFTDKPAASNAMKPFVSESGGVASVAPTERNDLARVRKVRWQDKAPLRLFRGDLHRHTDISADGMQDGDILDTYRYAIDAASLDFLAITDHSGHERLNYYHYDWWRNRQIATLFNNPGHFVTFFGYERTVTFPGGHRNIISTRRDSQPFRISDEEFYGVESYGDRLLPYVKAHGDIAIPHTTATGGGTDWRAADPLAQPVVEIFQGLRGSYEEPNTPIRGAGTRHPEGLVWSAWAKGYKIGVITSSDHRSTHESYACVYAPEFTAKSIHDAIKQRRTYGATDNIILKLEAASPDGRLYKMGQEFSAASPPDLRVEIYGTAPLSKVDVIGNGKILLSRAPGTPQDKFSFRDTALPSGTAYYYIRVVQANKQIAWSSPVWIDLAKQ